MHFERKIEFFLMFLQNAIMFRLTSGTKTSISFTNSLFFELNFLFYCVKKFSKTVRSVKFLSFLRYSCVCSVFLMLG